jgi:hypothetical protein
MLRFRSGSSLMRCDGKLHLVSVMVIEKIMLDLVERLFEVNKADTQ